MMGFNWKCFSVTWQFFSFFHKKAFTHYCVAVFSRSSHKELKIKNSLRKCLGKSSIFTKVVDLKKDTSNFLQKTLCTYYLLFKKASYWVWDLLKVSRAYFFFSRCEFWSLRASICLWNIHWTFPWDSPCQTYIL